MKNFNLGRLAFLLFFLNFAFYSIVVGYFIGGRSILTGLIFSVCWLPVEMAAFGWLEDSF